MSDYSDLLVHLVYRTVVDSKRPPSIKPLRLATLVAFDSKGSAPMMSETASQRHCLFYSCSCHYSC